MINGKYKKVFLSISNQIPPHLLQWQYELGDALLAAEVGQQLVGVHALAVPSLHQLGDDPLHLLLLGNSPEQLVVEDLTNREKGRIQIKHDFMSENTNTIFSI